MISEIEIANSVIQLLFFLLFFLGIILFIALIRIDGLSKYKRNINRFIIEKKLSQEYDDWNTERKSEELLKERGLI